MREYPLWGLNDRVSKRARCGFGSRMLQNIVTSFLDVATRVSAGLMCPYKPPRSKLSDPILLDILVGLTGQRYLKDILVGIEIARFPILSNTVSREVDFPNVESLGAILFI